MKTLSDKLIGVMEKRVLISHILDGMEGELDKLEINGGMSACDYLYAVWGVLMAEHVYKGGLPGEGEIDPLIKLYMDGETADVVNRLRRIYKNSLSKHTQFFKIEEINVFIRNKFQFLQKVSGKLTPQHSLDMQEKIEGLKSYIAELEV